MATNRDFTLRRHNGTDYDALLPTSHMGQIYTDSTLATTLGAHLTATYLPLAQKAAANGVAPLDANSKVPEAYLPGSVFGGMHFAGILIETTSEDSTTELLQQASSYATANDLDKLEGIYWICNVEGTLSIDNADHSVYTKDGQVYGVDTIDLHLGDWVIINQVDTPSIYFSIISNEQELATNTVYGLVQLANATTTGNISNKVITETVLSEMIGTTANKLAAGDHTHTGVYQPADTDLTTIAGLSTSDGNFIVGNGTTWTVESGADARASLGLTIGTNVQAYDAGLSSIAGLTTTAGKILYTTASDTYATATLTTYMRNLLSSDSAQSFHDNAQLLIDRDIQAYDAGLSAIADLAVTDGNFIVGNGSTWVVKSGADARESLGVYSASEVDGFFTNRPEIYYDTTTGTGIGDLIIDLD
jgi:hypothetical protein